MPPLADLQHRFLHAMMTGETSAGLFAGRVPPGRAISIHRNTVLGALTNALRLSYPTVDALVGTEFFDQACGVFVRRNLPHTPSLAAYGESFAVFLAEFGGAATLPYLPDVARLDRAVETALRQPLGARRFVLDAALSIDLPQSLVVLPLQYPADEIRAGLGDDSALAEIDTGPGERFLMVWRKDSTAAVKRVPPAAGRFLIALIAGEDAGSALQAACTRTPETEALQAIQTEIFAAAFCAVISPLQELPS